MLGAQDFLCGTVGTQDLEALAIGCFFRSILQDACVGIMRDII